MPKNLFIASFTSNNNYSIFLLACDYNLYLSYRFYSFLTKIFAELVTRKLLSFRNSFFLQKFLRKNLSLKSFSYFIFLSTMYNMTLYTCKYIDEIASFEWSAEIRLVFRFSRLSFSFFFFYSLITILIIKKLLKSASYLHI